MTSGGSVCRGRTAPVPVVKSNSVFESKATLGLPLTVASPSQREERNVGSESARPVIGPVKESSARVSSDAGDGKERSSSCGWHRSRFSARLGGGTGEGKAACKADGGRVAGGP